MVRGGIMIDEGHGENIFSCLRATRKPIDIKSKKRLLFKGMRLEMFDQYQRLGRLRRFVEEHYSEPIDLNTAAEVAVMEKCAFSRFFSTSVGLPYNNWLTRVRLGHALDLIESRARASLTDIAFAVGFSNLRSFQRSFKKYLGTTAIELKKSLNECRAGSSDLPEPQRGSTQ